MGASYTNILLRGPASEVVVKFMNFKQRKAFVSPVVGGCVIVFDEQCEEQDREVIAGLAREMSRQLKCSAWAVLDQDDEILIYWLCVNGEPVDQYDSTPWFFDESQPRTPKGGNAEKLCAAMGAAGQAAPVEAILRKEALSETGYAAAAQRHADLLKAMNLPLLPVNLGYEYLMRGEYQGDFDFSTLVRTGWE